MSATNTLKSQKFKNVIQEGLKDRRVVIVLAAILGAILGMCIRGLVK